MEESQTWRADEIERLRELWERGVKADVIAVKIGRSVKEVEKQISTGKFTSRTREG